MRALPASSSRNAVYNASDLLYQTLGLLSSSYTEKGARASSFGNYTISQLAVAAVEDHVPAVSVRAGAGSSGLVRLKMTLSIILRGLMIMS